ncbi:NAM-like protein-like [Striga asiatica]|uniref:NAM-like protein-like n=1 Tax=Striga asiatica TaxID=4170 RepID=A0A5A7QXW3_STRAF|nr:NAM-like protein-like [Striga asiatica]
MNRDPQDSNIMSNSDQNSNYDLASQFPNPHVHPNSESHPPGFHLNSTNELYPSHVDLQYGATPTFQSLLNTPIVRNPMVFNQSGVSNAHFPIYTPTPSFQTHGNTSLGSNRTPASTPMVTSKICGNTTYISNQNQATSKGLKNRVKDVQISSGKKNWALTNAWLNVSLDPIVGNNKKATAMWVRIHQVWKENMGPICKYLRSSNSLQCHWSIIHAAVSNFAGHYSKLERHPQSGTNSKDLIHKALGMYEDIEGSKFKWIHCWEIMIKNLKWQPKHDKNMAPDRQTDEENKSPTSEVLRSSKGIGGCRNLPSERSLLNILDENITPEGNNCDGVGRPTGRKNSKEKKRKLHDEKGVVDALNKLQSILAKQISINEKSLEMRKQNEEENIELKRQALNREMEMKMKEQRRKRQKTDNEPRLE